MCRLSTIPGILARLATLGLAAATIAATAVATTATAAATVTTAIAATGGLGLVLADACHHFAAGGLGGGLHHITA
ncbi:MAG: hypothetical protein Q8R59_01400, partial [Polaromonas sp.]|nr:hypothetical protein [Polaromonas sp.]